MVAGHLQEKNGLYYMVLSYSDTSGKRKTKWISTKLPVKGNKKKNTYRRAKTATNIPVPFKYFFTLGLIVLFVFFVFII